MVIRVLFADQSATIQRLAAQAFAQEKIEVIKVGNGDLATWLLDEINPDVVIADVSLPDRNGYELCQLIKDNPRLSHIPVLLLCWSDEAFDHEKANEARADAYLAKPFESRALVENVRRLLQESGEARGASIYTHAPADVEDGSVESVGPPHAASLFEEASFDTPSRPAGPEAEISPATEEPLPAPESLPEGGAMLEPTAGEEAFPLATAPTTAKEPEAISYSAASEQASPNSPADPGLISRRAGKAPLVWAVLAIIAFSAILGIWQAIRLRKTQPADTTNANISEVDQQSQGDSALSSAAPPEPPPESDSPDDKFIDRTDAPAGRLSPNLRSYSRSSNPRTSWPEPRVTPFANTYEDRRANNSYAANNNRPADLKGRILPPVKPPEPGRVAATPPKNNNSGPSPVRIIQSNAAAPVTNGKSKAETAAKPVVDQPNGFQQIGSGVKGAVTWTGRKASQGVKAIARELKRVFKPDRKID